MIRTEGIAPSQYGTKGLVGDKLAEIEEKYDLSAGAEGFGLEGEEDAKSVNDDEAAEGENEDEETAQTEGDGASF